MVTINQLIMSIGLYTMITKTDVEQSQLINASAKQWAINNLEYLNKPMRYLGSSLKVEKGRQGSHCYTMHGRGGGGM